ncbi:BTAD domain-containing putative transcriptional regulator [Actinosynnema sp. NPDC023794]
MIFRILGPLDADGLAFPPRQRAVLAMLLLQANRVVAVDRLVDAVWDTRPPSTAREQIQICVSAIRRALHGAGLPDVVVRQSPGYLIRCREDQLDLLAFDALVARARRASAGDDPRGAVAHYREALALWRGRPLDGVNGALADAARTALADRRISVVEEHVDVQLPLGPRPDLIGELAELVAANPFRERLRAQMMAALHAAGRRAEALEVYQDGRRLLIDELGLDPGEELSRVQRAILAGTSPAVHPDSTPGPTTHTAAAATSDRSSPSRFNPSPRPGSGFRADSASRSGFGSGSDPLSSAGARPNSASGWMPGRDPGSRPGPGTGPIAATRRAVPHLLPPTSRDFTGRTDLLTRVRDLLAPPTTDPGTRVVAVGGRAWSGKTALAVHAAHGLREDYPDGQLFVRLHGAGADPVDPAHALARFLRALGVPDPAIPPSTDERTDLYRDLIADRRVLVVLDDAADERQVTPLLPGSPTCAVIVTSRRGLTTLVGAWHVTTGPLTVGEGARLVTAVIGAERAGAQQDDVLRLAEECRGDPLALRLAGARLAARPHWPVATQTARLTAGDGWRELARDVEDPLTAPHARLSPVARRLLRRVGLLGPGPVEFPGTLCARFLETHPDEADDALAELVDAGLFELERAPDGGLTCHVGGLVVAFARQRPAGHARPRRVHAPRPKPDRTTGVVLALPSARASEPRELRTATSGR